MNTEKQTEGREMSERIHKIMREVRNFCEDGNQTEGDGHPECPFALCIADIDRALYLVTTLGQMHDNAAMLATRERRSLSAWMANVEEPQEVDASDLEAMIATARTQGRDSIMISARDLWRMASDKRGREEE
jgi:hypothetical protein